MTVLHLARKKIIKLILDITSLHVWMENNENALLENERQFILLAPGVLYES